MNVLVYAVLGPAADVPWHALPPGVDSGEVRRVTARRLVAAVSTAAEGALTPDATRALDFAKIVEALHARATVLPVRYTGATLASDAAVADMLDGREAEYLAGLDGVRGAVELGVRILVAPPALAVEPAAPSRGPASPETPGTAYLGRLSATRGAGARSSLAEALARVEQSLRPWAVSVVRDPPVPSAPGLGSLSFLVRREHEVSFRVAYDVLEAAEREVKLMLTGPWPPWSFAAVPPTAAVSSAAARP